MQLLWSRAAQTSSKCRCGSCLHAATTLARRATTAASKRRVKASDVFTACYSTMLGTAVFLDAAAKEERKREWDRKIAEVKAELKPRESQNERPVDEQKEYGRTAVFIGEAPEVADKTYMNCKPFPAVVDNNWTVIRTEQAESQLDVLLESINENLQQSTGSSKDILKETSTLFPTEFKSMDTEDLWIDYEPDPLLPNREPQTKVQMAKMETMVANLVERLLLASNIFKNSVGEPTPGDGGLAAETGEMAWQIRRLFTGHTILPSYSWLDDLTVHEQRMGLYQSLVSLSTKYPPTNDEAFDVLLSKICYNLLVARAPPTIGVYNFLMREFTSRQRPDLTQIVMDSFFNESRLRANQRTAILMLQHYASLQDHDGFRAIMKRMACTGKEGDMRIRARWKDDLHKPANAQWALTAKVFPRAGGLHERMPRSRELHEVIISHSLARSKPRAAIMYSQICLRETQQINLALLHETIQSFLAEASVLVSGFKLLQVVIKYFDQPIIGCPTVFPDLIIGSIYELLVFCGVDPSSRNQYHLPSFVARHALENMLRILRIEDLKSKLDEFAVWTSAVRGALMAPGGVDEALSYVDQTAKFQQFKDAEREKKYHFIRRGRFRAVEGSLRTSDIHIHKLAISIGESRIVAKEAMVEDLLGASSAADRLEWAEAGDLSYVPMQNPKRQYKQPLEVWTEQNLAQRDPEARRTISRKTTDLSHQYKSLAAQERENLEAQGEMLEERALSVETEILAIANAIGERRVAEQTISKEVELLLTAITMGEKAIRAKETILMDAIARRVDMEEQLIISNEVQLLTVAMAMTEREILAHQVLLEETPDSRHRAQEPRRKRHMEQRKRIIDGLEDRPKLAQMRYIPLVFEPLTTAIAMVDRRTISKGTAALAPAQGNGKASIDEQDRLRILEIEDVLAEATNRAQNVAELVPMMSTLSTQTTDSILTSQRSSPTTPPTPPLLATTIKSPRLSSPSKVSSLPRPRTLPLTTTTDQSSPEPALQMTVGQEEGGGPRIHLYTGKTRGTIPFRPVGRAVWSMKSQSIIDLR